ncbi:hypothetical protein BJ138DRAFT_38559 [Hygrophoropsis aurantiaca]|uniref:Uncharacterized protein n=1 Tax=Hygrophoropsis aurantiaca TaxID=72124 RepID=A0ACB7ZSB2_9AGAM|nr:hypothetical protein BJ138DRAFT_38559 [Hygrophoropsis aurantiaca]
MMQNHHCPTFIQSMVLAYLSGASAVTLLLQVLLLLLARKLHTRRLEGSQSMSTQETGLNDLVSEHRDVSTERFALEQGGRVIYGYKCARFIGCLALWGLSVETSLPRAKEDSHDLRHQLCSSAMQCHQFALCVTTGYTSLLGFISITARSRWSKPASTHLSILLLAVFAIFVSRDLFPLATFTTQPEDIGEGWLLWAKIIILAIVSVVLPLVTPRQYTPFDPTDPAKSPHPEQTASWLSMLLYTWEDPIVYLAYKSPHLSHEQLPPMADQDYSKNLVKKSFVHLDPFSGSKRRHLFIGLMKVYRLHKSCESCGSQVSP